MKILARQFCRTGIQTLYVLNGKFFMNIKNRTYESTVQIPADRVSSWIEHMKR